MKVIVVSAILSLSPLLASAQQQGLLPVEPFHERISLSTQGDDQLASQLRIDLRSIPSVVVTESSPEIVVSVLTLLVGPASRPGGLASAVLVTSEPTDVQRFWRVIQLIAKCECKGEPMETGLVGLSVKGRVDVKGFTIITGTLDRAEMAHRIAAYVDKEAIEPARQAHESMEENLRKAQARPTPP